MEKTNEKKVSDTDKKQANNTDENKAKITPLIIGVVVLLVILIVFVGYFVYFSKKNPEKSNSNDQTANVKVTQNSSETAPSEKTPSNPDLENSNLGQAQLQSSVWEIEHQDKEKSPEGLSEKYLIYAIKNEYTVSVYKKSLTDLSREKIFDFEENKEALRSGNFWEELPPSISLSPDKQWIAYTDKEGLKIYNLETKEVKALVKKISVPEDQEKTPQWSDKLLNSSEGTNDGIFDLASPEWSFNGKYISFQGIAGEGMGILIVDCQSAKVYRSSSLIWSPTSNSYIDMDRGSAEFSDENRGFNIVSGDNFDKSTNIAKIFGQEKAVFYEAGFSPDGKKVFFTFTDSYNDSCDVKANLAVANVDGTNFTMIATADNNSSTAGSETDSCEAIHVIKGYWPIFLPDGNSLLYYKDNSLIKADLATREMTKIADLPQELANWKNVGWTKDGFLIAKGIYNLFDGIRYYIIDIQNKKIIYRSQIFSGFTTFAGLTD